MKKIVCTNFLDRNSNGNRWRSRSEDPFLGDAQSFKSLIAIDVRFIQASKPESRIGVDVVALCDRVNGNPEMLPDKSKGVMLEYDQWSKCFKAKDCKVYGCGTMVLYPDGAIMVIDPIFVPAKA